MAILVGNIFFLSLISVMAVVVWSCWWLVVVGGRLLLVFCLNINDVMNRNDSVCTLNVQWLSGRSEIPA